SLMSLLGERKLYRLLIKPAAEGITPLLLESAVGRYFELRSEGSLAKSAPERVDDVVPRDHYEPPAVLVDEIPPTSFARRSRSRRSSGSPWLIATGVAAAVVAVIVAGESYGVRWRAPIDRVVALAAPSLLDVDKEIEPAAAPLSSRPFAAGF